MFDHLTQKKWFRFNMAYAFKSPFYFGSYSTLFVSSSFYTFRYLIHNFRRIPEVLWCVSKMAGTSWWVWWALARAAAAIPASTQRWPSIQTGSLTGSVFSTQLNSKFGAFFSSASKQKMTLRGRHIGQHFSTKIFLAPFFVFLVAWRLSISNTFYSFIL